jgi:hypothetical protein
MKPFKRSQYQYNKKTIFYFILFYLSQKVYVIDKVQFTTTRRINHRTECYPSNQQPQVFLTRLIIADIQIHQKSIFYLSKMQEQSDSTLSYQKPLKDPQRKGLTRLSLVDHRRYHLVQFLILSLVRILFHRSKV